MTIEYLCRVSGSLMSRRMTYAMIPATAASTPITALSPMARPDIIQPMAMMVHVLRWPTTVLDTGPVWATMKNWDILINEANTPD